MSTMPHIKKYNDIPTLFVRDEPFIALAGEIHNSSSSDLEYMEKQVWPNLKTLNMNSVIVPVYWELIEPEENQFDFTLVEGLITQARENNMHLIFLWFGLWKNSESMYVPHWMKKDSRTYFRACKPSGEAINTISPLCAAAIEKDANAFYHLMKFIKSIDSEENTVIVMQVENEIGLLGTDRDYSFTANKAFSQEVPQSVAEEFQVSGTWEEAFGYDAGEYFMAYYFSSAVERITNAGQQAYPLPCYANAWLEQFPWRAGTYPSGGPVMKMDKMWKLMAPSLFCLAPDIYVPYVADVMDEYSQDGNPLFIPEVRKDAVSATYALYAVGGCNAICYAPFGIEELLMNPESIDKPPVEIMLSLNIDPSAFEIEGSAAYLAKSYSIIENIKPLYFKYRGTSHLQSYVKRNEHDFGKFLHFGAYDILVSYSPKAPNKPTSGGLIIELSENEFVVIGTMTKVQFFSKPGKKTHVELLRFEEGEFVNGEWNAGRVLNGDEKMMIQLKDMPSAYRIQVYEY
ncbi:DUF5597 domain-containing protein [Bacillus sp. ISL-18]|uniref:DUF5597 domain-containing protein n=1 Tax=Bacillus sp. ISL-18 TaxID=2819118 RepID=UPI001BE91A30|nr:DUF5597 domain-containing protein [Bacillus sp. ISL-18]MBT2654770.1 DUF5597 domain-containing protein [Bacillus sp. ISL-18]